MVKRILLLLGISCVVLGAFRLMTLAVIAQTTDDKPFKAYLPIVLSAPCHYVDNFDNSYSGWPSKTDSSPFYGYDDNGKSGDERDGHYYLIHLEADRWVGVTRGDIWQSGELKLQVRGEASGEILDKKFGIFGLLFGLNEDWSEFHTFEVHQDTQKWRLFHYTASNGFELLNSGENDAIPESGTAVTLTIETKVPGVFSLKAGSKEVTLITEKPGRVGLVGASLAENVELQFDDYRHGCPQDDEQQRGSNWSVFETARPQE